MKCLPLKYLTNGFGAVKLMSALGRKSFPGPESGGPVSIFQDEGASTERTGRPVLERASIMEGKGSRTSPVNEKPAGVVRGGKYGQRQKYEREDVRERERGKKIEGNTENSIHNGVCFFESGVEIIDERN